MSGMVVEVEPSQPYSVIFSFYETDGSRAVWQMASDIEV